jgi:hypothetical protein
MEIIAYSTPLLTGLAHFITVRPDTAYMFRMPKALHTLCWWRLAALHLQVAQHEQTDQFLSTERGNLAYAEQPSNDGGHVARQQTADTSSQIRD